MTLKLRQRGYLVEESRDFGPWKSKYGFRLANDDNYMAASVDLRKVFLQKVVDLVVKMLPEGVGKEEVVAEFSPYGLLVEFDGGFVSDSSRGEPAVFRRNDWSGSVSYDEKAREFTVEVDYSVARKRIFNQRRGYRNDNSVATLARWFVDMIMEGKARALAKGAGK